jgi:hypothetical protein
MALAVEGPGWGIGVRVARGGEERRGFRSRGGGEGVGVEIHEEDGSRDLSAIREGDRVARQHLPRVPAEGVDVVTLQSRHRHHHVQHPVPVHVADGGCLIDPSREPETERGSEERERGGGAPGVPEDVPLEGEADHIAREVADDHLEVRSAAKISDGHLGLDLVELHREEPPREARVAWGG